MRKINEAQVAEPGLAVVEVAAADNPLVRPPGQRPAGDHGPP
ncbi:DUF6207 family protein [Streptomyces afghaniensis]